MIEQTVKKDNESGLQVYITQGKITKLSSPRLLAVLAELELAERLAESNTVDGLLDDVGAGAVDLADEALAVSVDNKTKQVGAHVVAAEVVESLAEVGLVKVDVDVDEALEVLGRLGDQRLAVRAVDAGVAVVDVVVFGSLARWGLEGDTGGRRVRQRSTKPADASPPASPSKPQSPGSVPPSPWPEFPLKDNYPRVPDPAEAEREVSTKQANRPFLAYVLQYV